MGEENNQDDPEYQMDLMQAKIQGCINFLTGMSYDPSIPNHAKMAAREKASDLDEFLKPLRD